MGFLSKLRAKAPDDGLILDKCLGDAEAARLRDEVDAGRTDAFRQALETTTDLERRDFLLLIVLSSITKRSNWIDQWAHERPTEALPRIAGGREFVDIAWEVRGAKTGDKVSQRQFDQFFVNLDLAWSRFEAAIAADPAEGSTYALMIDCAKGLDLPIQDRVALYERAQETRPWQQIAHRSTVQALAAKWGGSSEMMLDFARQASAGAPAGSGVHVVVPEAHIEAWIQADATDAYWRAPGVRDEITEAAARSIDQTVASRGPWDKRDRNAFAFCYWQMGEQERARREFELIGPIVAGPFMNWADPVGASRKARQAVGTA